jgi:hypothetical protein
MTDADRALRRSAKQRTGNGGEIEVIDGWISA